MLLEVSRILSTYMLFICVKIGEFTLEIYTLPALENPGCSSSAWRRKEGISVSVPKFKSSSKVY